LLLVSNIPWIFSTTLIGQPGYLRQFYDVSVASSNDGTLLEYGSYENIETHDVPMIRGINPFADLRSIFHMVKLIRRLRPEIVHSYTPKAGLVSMLSAWMCRVPVRIHTFTGLIFPTQTGFKQQLLIWIDRLICACATMVVPEGLGVRNDLRRYKITGKPLNVIGYGNIAGVDTSVFSPGIPSVQVDSEELCSRSDGGFVFCFVGRINRDKGIRELVQAFARLPKKACLLLVGWEDPEAPVDDDTKEIIRRSENIISLGFMRDIRPALAASDVLVLPSYREGFPNVVLQAGAMCLPVIASDISGCNEVIEPGMNGWLVPPKDSDALYSAMQCAMDLQREAISEMGKRARMRIVERFERNEHWERMRRFYNECAA
jgi:glycosyltransferase involved in cell wall biosynthesis